MGALNSFRGLLGLVLTTAVALALAAASVGAVVDSPALIVNRGVGDVRMGESESQVEYDYGSDCQTGCPGLADGGCVIGLRACVGPTYTYDVGGGYLRVGYNQHRIVYIETNSPRYVAGSGLRVGAKIPFGTRYGSFRWHTCTASGGYWIAGSSWTKPLSGHARTRWWTQLAVTRGVVKVISMWRGDGHMQKC